MSTQILWFATRGSGIVSLILFSAVACLGLLAVARAQSAAWPRFLTVELHRNLALLSVVFLALHIVTAVLDPFTLLGHRGRPRPARFLVSAAAGRARA